jgi:hypothetical protein
MTNIGHVNMRRARVVSLVAPSAPLATPLGHLSRVAGRLACGATPSAPLGHLSRYWTGFNCRRNKYVHIFLRIV